MFNWTVSLSDKQVIMLMAFAAGTPSETGCLFHSVHAMIGDAWDCRAVRKLQELDMLAVYESLDSNTGFKVNKWTITEKGKLIAKAIQCDAQSLGQIQLRNGLAARSIINTDDNKRWREKKEKKERKKAQV